MGSFNHPQALRNGAQKPRASYINKPREASRNRLHPNDFFASVGEKGLRVNRLHDTLMKMMKSAGYILAAMTALAWAADEVGSYAEGLERVGGDGWVLLCHSADWDSTHEEQWMRRHTSLRSACGNALILYVPIYQNPTPEQRAEVERLLEGAPIAANGLGLHSVPCAVLLDRDGRPYATISGNDFMDNAAGHIRHAQTQQRTRNNLLRQASTEEGPQKAETLSRIWRLSITPPPDLREQMKAADPEDKAGIAEWTPFDPWALAERIRKMSWQDAIAELDRVQQAPLSKEERQTVLAIRIGCVHHHLGAAGSKEIHSLANACTALAPGTPLGKAAQRAASLWGNRLDLGTGWNAGQLPRVAAECEITGTRYLARAGEYHIEFIPTGGTDPVNVTRVTLYDGDTVISEDIHSCSLKPQEKLEHHKYMLIVRQASSHPRLVIAFDQQGKTNTQGRFLLRYFNEDGLEITKADKAKEATEKAKEASDKAREEISKRELKAEGEEEASESESNSTLAPKPTSTLTPKAEPAVAPQTVSEALE